MYYCVVILDICGESSVFQLIPEISYNLTSPGYPDFYPINTDCTWTIHAENEDGFPKIDILRMDLYDGLDFVYMMFGDNNTLTFTGVETQVPSSITANGTDVKIQFVSYKWKFKHYGFVFHLSWTPKNGKRHINIALNFIAIS